MQAYFRQARERSWRIYTRYYPDSCYKRHRTRYLEAITPYLTPEAYLLDAGCGSEMEFTRQVCQKVRIAVGLDIEQLQPVTSIPYATRGDLSRLPFKDGTFDIIISESVFEHLSDPEAVFCEFSRVLKQNGVIVVLTPNKYDYVSLVSMATPFWFHRWILSLTLDKKEEDTFPTFYRANTRKQFIKLCRHSGLTPLNVSLLNQYPAYLLFWPMLFRLGILYERLTSRYEILAQLCSWILAIAQKKA